MRAVVCRVVDEQQQHSLTAGDSSSSVLSLSRWLSQSLTSLRSRLIETTTPLVDSSSDGLELSVNAVESMELGGLTDSDV